VLGRVTSDAIAILIAGYTVVGTVRTGGTRSTGHCQLLPALFKTGIITTQVVPEGTRGANCEGSAGCALGETAETLPGQLVVARHADAAESRVQGSVSLDFAGETREVA
jgi:hypothetical protein